jgi:4'-phosphopantetheinyl transferase
MNVQPPLGIRETGMPDFVNVRCEVWWARPSDARPWHAELLNGAERRRRAALQRRGDRDRFSVACAVARLVLAEHLSVAPSAVPLDASTGVPRQRAGRDGPWVSVAHAGTRVAIAICDVVPVGIEIVPMRATLDLDGIARVALSPAEADRLDLLQADVRPGALLALWARKSAVLKAAGAPLVSPTLVAAAGDRAIVPGERRPASVVGLHPGPGHVAALAVLGPPPIEVVERDAGLRLTGGAAPTPGGELPGPRRALA